jgi:phosphoribosylamine-glycine ligase
VEKKPAPKSQISNENSNEKKPGKKMIILILGKNGNCHSLAWKLNKSPNVEKIYVQSRNAGTTMLKIPSFQDRNFYRAPQNKIQILTGIDETNPEDILGLAKNLNIDLVVPADSSYFLSDDIQEKLREGKFSFLNRKA